jgi:hypothetical protein
VHCVEDLASLSDSHIHILPNGQRLREQAKVFIETDGDTKQSRELAAENRQMKEQLATLTKQVEALSKRGKAA